MSDTSDIYKSRFEGLFHSPQAPNEKILLASELGSELLVSYLRRTSGGEYLQHFSDMFTQVLRNATGYNCSWFSTKLENGWDIQSEISYLNHDEKVACLSIVLSTNRILELQKADTSHPLVLELSVMRYIADKYKTTNSSVYKFIIIAFDRLYTDYKSMPTQAITYIEPELLSIAETENRLIEYTDQLQHYIDTCTLPPRCTDIKWHRRRGKSINMTCQRCPVRNSCPHTNSFTHTNATLDNIIF